MVLLLWCPFKMKFKKLPLLQITSTEEILDPNPKWFSPQLLKPVISI